MSSDGWVRFLRPPLTRARLSESISLQPHSDGLADGRTVILLHVVQAGSHRFDLERCDALATPGDDRLGDEAAGIEREKKLGHPGRSGEPVAVGLYARYYVGRLALHRYVARKREHRATCLAL